MTDISATGSLTATYSVRPPAAKGAGAFAATSATSATPATPATVQPSGAASTFQDLSASLQALLIQQQAQAGASTGGSSQTVPGNLDPSGTAAPGMQHHHHHHHGQGGAPSGAGATLAADLQSALGSPTGATAV